MRTKRLRILGRKKEMIVSPERAERFPEDVERVLNAIDGRARIGRGGGEAGRAANRFMRCWCWTPARMRKP